MPITSLDYTLTHGRLNMVGVSRVMHEQVYGVIDKVGHTLASVLIKGERGTGKELVAKAIYLASHLAGKPFIKANCAAIPSELLESELFGHVKGSFSSGSSYDRKGLFGAANYGTLFLDEIADMSVALQAKLLRAVEYGEIRKVGSDEPIEVHVRLISSTNRDLLKARREGAFRDDLYDRIAQIVMIVPPLRERSRDIPYLILHFMQQLQKEHGMKVAPFTAKEYMTYRSYEWPGNVRELRNAIERVVIERADKMDILKEIMRESGYFLKREDFVTPTPASSSLNDIIQNKILITIRECKGNISLTAEKLGISRQTVTKHLYGIFTKDDLSGILTQSNGDVTIAARLLGIGTHTFYGLARHHKIPL